MFYLYVNYTVNYIWVLYQYFFFIFYFLFMCYIIMGVWKLLEKTGIWKPMGIIRVWKLPKITGVWKSPGIMEVWKNRQKIIIFQGFVKTVGNLLATLNLLGKKQTTDNVLNEVKTIENAIIKPVKNIFF